MRVGGCLVIGHAGCFPRLDGRGRRRGERAGVVDVTGVLAHWYTGRSKNQISESLGLDRKTVRKYLARRRRGG